MPTLHKIDPHNLRDTLVELRYEGMYDFTLLKGMLFQAFEDDLVSLNPVANVKIQLRGQGEIKLNGFEGLDFRRDEVKITFTDERILFNTLAKYPGWETYFALIESVIDRLKDRQLIRHVRQVGLRYISDHRHYRITDIAKVNWTLETRFGSLTQGTLRQQYRHDGDTVTVTLADSAVLDANASSVAVMDIDVTHQFEPHATDLISVMDTIERLHSVQKMYFEDLIRPDYLTSLNPQYK